MTTILLFKASAAGKSDVVAYLLKRGVAVTSKNKLNQTALHMGIFT